MSRGKPQRCPFCHDALGFEERQSCTGCGALYHRECLSGELGRCAVIGCEAPAAPAESSAPFAGAVRQLVRGSELQGVEPFAERGSYLREGETPLARVRTAGSHFVLTDRGVWRDGKRHFDYEELGTVGWYKGQVGVRLGRDLTSEFHLLTVGDSVEDRLASIALERLLSPLAAYVPAHTYDRCLVCLQATERAATVYSCEGCLVTYHPACLKTASGCVDSNCRGSRATPRKARDWLEVLGNRRPPDVPLARASQEHAPSDADRLRSCARCKRAFTRGDLSYRCSCGVALHAECMRSLGSCGTEGCVATAAEACRFEPSSSTQAFSGVLWLMTLCAWVGGPALFTGSQNILGLLVVLAGLVPATLALSLPDADTKHRALRAAGRGESQ